LIVAQVTVWFVVRRFLVAGDDWTVFALRPGTPSELGFLISPFVHLEPAHLGINLAVLWLVGTNLERAVGSLKFLVLYLGAGWFGSLMHWAAAVSFHLAPDLSQRGAAVGSSGAVAGVLGATVVRLPQPRLRLPLFPQWSFPATPLIAAWLAYTLIRALISSVSGVTEGVGHWAHFAGFIFGLAIAQVAGMHRQARREYLERAAVEAAEKKNLPAAAQAWSALLAARPGDLRVRTELVRTRLALGDVPGARRLAREGIAALVRAGDRPASLEAYREYTRLVPDLDLPSGIRYRVGCWLADSGDNEGAFRSLWESVREDGATPAAASALYRAGQVAWERLRSPAHAREAWERLLEQFPDSAWTDAAREGLRQLPA
jgi:membrane associated rhomboid family serine protease